MNGNYLNVLRTAIAQRAEAAKEPNSQWTSEMPYRISVALCCVELGDTRGLDMWLTRIEENPSPDPLGIYEPIVTAAKLLLVRWQEVEAVFGAGALLDYASCLRSSPAEIFGVQRIENARRFQETRNRVADDPFWALQFG